VPSLQSEVSGQGKYTVFFRCGTIEQGNVIQRSAKQAGMGEPGDEVGEGGRARTACGFDALGDVERLIELIVQLVINESTGLQKNRIESNVSQA